MFTKTWITAMRACFLFGLALLQGTAVAFAQMEQTEIGIIPKPVKLIRRPGQFRLAPDCNIFVPPHSAEVTATAEYFVRTLRDASGVALRIETSRAPKDGCIFLQITSNSSLGKEGYHLEISPQRVLMEAPSSAGLFYGIQTLRQLLPPETFNAGPAPKPKPFDLPCAEITDYPRFGWRGLHLDVSRHFFGVEFIKSYLDEMAMHKLNVFHWHLSDDDGWRIEIKSYPKLTKVGAWRGANEALPPSYESGRQRYGGFYTQKEVRELVRYAAVRHITIVPEIDVPAHCRAAIVSYPELLCAGDPYKFKSVQEVAANVLCPSQDKTYAFLEAVFGELADLFPGRYIHAGGDERPKGPWEQCDRCLQRMRQEHLADGNVLQDRFLKRLQVFLKSRGKTMVGWDELDHETVLDKDYTVMAWTSVEAGLGAA